MFPRSALLLALAIVPAASAEDPGPRPAALSSSLRERLDRLALRLPGDTLDRQALRSVEGVPHWLLTSEDLTAEEEARRAAEARDRLLDGRPAAPTPAAAQRVFDRLVAELPPHLKPAEFRCRLTALDRPGRDAFTTGGGLVFVARPWADDLLADLDRGEAALAFVLAGEIGHAALGHTRRGWEWRDAVEGAAACSPLPLPRAELAVALGAGPEPGRFIYTGVEQEEADRFALHLCRNAGFDLDAALDPVRFDARAYSDDKDDGSTVDSPETAALARLKRLLTERDGLFDDEATHGLFVYDPESGRLGRCGPRQVGAGERPVVFVHGLRGTEYAFGAYLSFLAKRPETAGRPLLVFRYPNNESLSRCAEFLGREMRRCVAEPDKAVFVCHSAGGLVFRWYAEVRNGGFDRAIFLATPHGGTHMADYKGFVDVGRFILDLPRGADYALADAFGEGDGQVRYDLEPDSLFLRRLDREKPFVERYQIFYGQLLDFWQSLQLQAAFLFGKQYVLEAVADFVPFPGWQSRLTRWVVELPLPEEIASGDLAVSARSARLPGVPRATGVPLMHEAFRYDPDLMRRVLDAIVDR